MLNSSNPIKVFIACSGLGRVQRGYEAFYQDIFTVLSQESSLDLTLFKGGGNFQEKSITLWNISRYNRLLIMVQRYQKILQITKRKKFYFTEKEAYYIEQFSFFLSFLPYLYRQKPQVIYFSDRELGDWLWWWRNFTRQNYKLLFRNGAPFLPPFPHWNHVQQITPTELQRALDAGEPASKLSFIPHGFSIPSQLHVLAPEAKEALRSRLGLPEKQSLVLSVGYIQKSHKRMDYVIREVASLSEPRPYLLLLGQQDFKGETQEVVKLGNQLLGVDNFQARTVSYTEISDYYKTANIFVLASLIEAFGRVFVEAMSHGLPCLAHDYEVTRFILGQEGYFADFRVTGSLANLISQVLAEGKEELKCDRRHRLAYERFSWEQLRPDYVKMIHHCAAEQENKYQLN